MVELIVSGIAALIGVMFNAAVELLAPLLGFSFTQFNETFPFALTAYSVFQSISLGIILLIAAVQLIPFIRQSQKSKTTPIRIAISVLVAVFGVYYGNYMLEGLMQIAQQPYNAFSDAGVYAFNGISFNPVTSAISDLCYQTSALLFVFILILIGIAFIKLLLECVERYVILFVLVYTSPLAFSTLASEETSGIFKKYFGMFMSQCILMVLSMWSLKMVVSNFVNLGANANKAMALIMCYSFLRIAQRMDSYLNQLGLNAAITGAGLGGELMSAGMMMVSQFGGMMGGGKSFGGGGAGGTGSENGGGSGGGNNPVLGAGKALANFVGKTSPIAGAGDYLKNTAAAGIHSLGHGIVAGKAAAAGATGSVIDRAKAAFSAGGKATKAQMGPEMHKANMKTQDSNLWARAFGQRKDPNAQNAADTLSAGHVLDDSQREDIAGQSFMAAKAFNAFDGSTAEANNPSDVAAVMRGTGIENSVAGASDAINAGYGLNDALDTEFSLGASGIQAKFTRDGKTETWNIKNASQFQSLSSEQQAMYTPYRDKNGNRYYYSKSTSRAPSEAQRQRAAQDAEVQRFVQNPTQNHISPATFSAMQKQPDFTKNVFEGFAQNGTAMQYSKENAKQFSGIVEGTKFDGMKPADKQRMVMQMRSDEMIGATANGNGMQAEWEAGGNYHRFTMLTQSGMEKNGLDESNLAAKGYVHNNANGMDFWTLHEQMPSEKAKDPITRDANRETI